MHFAILITGCTSPKGTAILTPIPTSLPEYTISGEKVVFSREGITVSLLPLHSSEIKHMLFQHPLAEILSSPHYVAFLLDIENTTKEKIIYNPVLTTLFDNNMGLHKPLDYTDLYTLVEAPPGPEASLQGVKDMFYDLGVTLQPGERASRLLLFTAPDEGSSEAIIKMKDIYIGTTPIALSFKFTITEEGNAK